MFDLLPVILQEAEVASQSPAEYAHQALFTYGLPCRYRHFPPFSSNTISDRWFQRSLDPPCRSVQRRVQSSLSSSELSASEQRTTDLRLNAKVDGVPRRTFLAPMRAETVLKQAIISHVSQIPAAWVTIATRPELERTQPLDQGTCTIPKIAQQETRDLYRGLYTCLSRLTQRLRRAVALARQVSLSWPVCCLTRLTEEANSRERQEKRIEENIEL